MNDRSMNTREAGKRLHDPLPLLLVVAAATQLGATDCGQVIRDPGFDLWCGDQPCAWKLVRGEIRKAPTWHQADAGLELVGPDTAVEQRTSVNSDDGHCIEFSLVANVSQDAEVFLDIDVQNDGTVERHERIPTSRWAPLSFAILVAPPYDGIRFELTKGGAGTAVLAQIDAVLSDRCEGIAPIEVAPRANGARCVAPDDCASGLCVPSWTGGGGWFGLVCAGCDPALGASACAAGEVCGLADPVLPSLDVPIRCVPAGARELAEQCLGPDECASGMCSITDMRAGVCSGCAPGGCNGTCDASWGGADFSLPGPLVCGPGQHTGATGAPCGTDLDCASGHCTGTPRKQCRDGRACDSPMDCPADDGISLAPGGCNLVGVQGGSCA